MLKLIYLEMLGHDMSWASFHVLEVMSSPKYHQKRVGYLGAVQSFRPDTEVLMLATNLLKKVRSPRAFRDLLLIRNTRTSAPHHRQLSRYRSVLSHTSSRPRWPCQSWPTSSHASATLTPRSARKPSLPSTDWPWSTPRRCGQRGPRLRSVLWTRAKTRV